MHRNRAITIMHSIQLIKLLKVLTPEEHKQLTIYLKKQSATSLIVLRLYAHLKKYAPAYHSAKLARDTVIKYVYKNDKVTNQQFNKIVFQLKQQVENFILHLELLQKPLQREKLMLTALKNRNYSGYAKRNRKFMATFQDSFDAEQPLAFYHDSFQLNYALWSAITTEKLGDNYIYFQSANADFDSYYYLLKLKIILENLLVRQLTSQKNKLPNEEAALTLIKAHPTFSKAMLPTLLLQAIELVQVGTFQHFDTLKTHFFTHVQIIPKKEARDLVIVLNNFFIQNINKIAELTTVDGFELYALADQHQLLIEHGQIRDIEYSNAVSLALDNRQFDWAINFINRYKPYLPIQIRDTTSTYLNAFWHFKKQEFEAVIKLLNPIEKSKDATIIIAIKIRTLKIRALLESENAIEELSAKALNTLKSQIRNFARFIHTHKKLGQPKKMAYIAFCDCLHKLLKIMGPLDKQLLQLTKLQQRIEQNQQVALKDWLMDKINRIQKHLSA